MKRYSIDISSKTLFKIFVFLLIIAVTVKLSQLILIIITGVILSTFTNTLAKPLMKIGVPRIPSIILVIIGSLSIASFLFYMIIPQLASEIGTIISAFPENSRISSAITAFSDFENARRALSSSELVNTTIFADTIKNLLGSFSSDLLSGVTGIFEGLLNIILVFIISFYISAQKDGVTNFLKAITPKKYESYVISLWSRTEKKIGYWLKGQLLSAAILSGLTYIGLTVLGIPYAVALSLIVAISSLIPFGISVGTIPALIIAFMSGGFDAMIMVLILYIALQQIQDYGFQPYIVGKATGVPSLAILISFVAGISLVGVWGIFLGLPFAIMISEYLNDIDTGQIPE